LRTSEGSPRKRGCARVTVLASRGIDDFDADRLRE
jgi:hypothetical protein